MPGPLTYQPLAATPGGARDPEAYFVAAYGLLSEGGCGAVTVGALCQRMHATTGSFYHHFADMPAFVTAFADRWRRGLMSWFAECADVQDPLRRHEKISNEGADFLFSGGESAIRAWAHTEPALASALVLAHLTGQELSIRTYEEILGDAELAGVLLALAICMTTGLSLRADGSVDPELYSQMTREFGRRSVGIETELVEIDGRLRLRFIDGVCADLPADPPWISPQVRGLDWIAGGHSSNGVGPDGASRSRADYFAAARELLAQHGSDGLTVNALCRQLGVTKGSFRWHFETMASFVGGLAEHWAQSHDDRLAPAVAEPDPRARLALLFRHMLWAPDPADVAFRAWAHTEPEVGRVLRAIDRRRQEVFARTIREATGDPAAEVLGDGMLWLAIGLHQNQPGVDAATAARIVLAFARRYLRVDAELQVADNQPIFRVGRPTSVE